MRSHVANASAPTPGSCTKESLCTCCILPIYAICGEMGCMMAARINEQLYDVIVGRYYLR